MTVGIATICEVDTPEPKIVVAADRLVTSGAAAPREYEHTSSKMVSIYGEDGGEVVTAMGVAAGSVSLADEVFYKVQQKIANETPNSARQVAQFGVTALQELVRETINRQVLSAQGLDLQTFNQIQGQMNQGVVQGIYSDMMEKQDEVLTQINILLAGVDDTGAHLYNIRQNDMARVDSIGYLTVGSGAEPANSTFIRNRYDDNCSIDDALHAVTEAKSQAEEAQGVGRQMDIAVMDDEGRRDLTDEEIKELRSVYKDVIKAEQDARDDVMEENNYTFDL